MNVLLLTNTSKNCNYYEIHHYIKYKILNILIKFNCFFLYFKQIKYSSKIINLTLNCSSLYFIHSRRYSLKQILIIIYKNLLLFIPTNDILLF